MKLTKRLLAALLALAAAVSVTGCSKSKKDDSYQDKVKVPSTDAIAEIPEGAENTLQYLGISDLNPTSDAQEKSVEMTLFNDKGGKVEYIKTDQRGLSSKLSSLILADTPPDMVSYGIGIMVYPCNIVKGLFQPVDDIVDFDSDIWSDMKPIADQFTIAGKHYVAPTSFGDTVPLMFYDKKVIANEGLADPYELYLDGEWDWNACTDIMTEYVSNATGDEERYGVWGWFPEPIFTTTGTTIIKYDEKKDEYVNNSNDPNLERAANYLYNIEKDGLINPEGWLGNPKSTFEHNTLFCSLGRWAAVTNNAPQTGDDWMCVPIPKDPNSDKYYRALDITVPTNTMWIAGSTKKEAMKCWLECCKVANTNEEYKKANKEKFFENAPNWSEEMYNMAFEEVFSDKFTLIFDPGTGISSELSDDSAAQNAEGKAINQYMYLATTKYDYASGGAQFTWSQIRQKYSATIDSELKKFNKSYKEFLKKNK